MVFRFKVWLYHLRFIRQHWKPCISRMTWKIKFNWKYRALDPQWRGYLHSTWGSLHAHSDNLGRNPWQQKQLTEEKDTVNFLPETHSRE